MNDKLDLTRKPLLIFDFDGTIADSFMTFVNIAEEMADEIGFDKSSLDHLDELRKLGTRKLMEGMGVSWWELPWYAFRARRKFTEKIDTVPPIDGVLSTLQSLKEAGYQMGIISSNTKNNVKWWLDKYEISDLFNFVFASSLFGKQSVIKKVLKQEGYTNTEAIYIGDESRDTVSANKAHVPSIAVTWGFNSREAHESINAEWIIDDSKELLDVLLNLA